MSSSAKIGIVAGLLVFTGLFYFLADYWLWISGAGAFLILLAAVAPVSKQKEETMSLQQSADVSMSKLFPVWDEREITLGVEKYRGSEVLGAFVRHLFSRFIISEATETAKRRIEFLQQFNKYADVARETYTRLRIMAGDRAKKEEDVADLQIQLLLVQQQTALAKAEADLAQVELENEARRLTKELAIAQLNKQIADVKRPAATPRRPKKRTEDDIEADIAQTYTEDEQINADSGIPENDKMRRKNINARRREKLLEELERLKTSK